MDAGRGREGELGQQVRSDRSSSSTTNRCTEFQPQVRSAGCILLPIAFCIVALVN